MPHLDPKSDPNRSPESESAAESHERTNVLTEKSLTDVDQVRVVDASARTPIRTLSTGITDDSLAVLDGIAAECLPDERNVR